MKAILPLVCAALILAPVGAEAHARLNVTGLVKVVAAFDDQRWGKHHGDGDHSDNGDNNNGGQHGNWRDNNGGNNGDGGHRNGGGQNGGGDINRAIAIAQSRGRVLDAWPMGGSYFGVRVATDRGRVDLTVDTDSGRIVSEH